MHTLQVQLKNPLTKERDARDRARLIALFPELESQIEPRFLALRRYLDCRPERFFDKTTYQSYLDWLKEQDKSNGNRLRNYLSDKDAEINRALLFLREINAENWHDNSLQTGNEYDLIRFIDKRIHPAYLRLVEAVFTPLARPVAYYSRLDAGKGTDGLDVWQVIQELAGGARDIFVRPYKHIIRNGISHGGITYLQNKIRYRDNRGNEETFSTTYVVRLCDDLLDICNALAAALKVFLIVARAHEYSHPRELLIEELQ